MSNEIKFDTQEWPRVVQVAAYIRVSTDEQTQKQWPEVQLGSIKKYLESMSNSDVVYELQEKHIYNETVDFKWVKWDTPIEKRPQMSKMFQDIKEHIAIYDQPPFDRLVVWKIDRAARKTLLLYQIVEELQKYDIYFVSVTEYFDVSTPFGKAILGILGAFAELEKTQIVQRTGQSKEISRKKWKVNQEVYWYKKDKFWYLELYELEAEIVRRIYQEFVIKNMSIREIRDSLESDKISIPRVATTEKSTNQHEEIVSAKAKVSDAYRRRDGTVRSILQNEVYIWMLYYGKSKTVRDKKTWTVKEVSIPKHEWKIADIKSSKIIDNDLFEAAQEKFWERIGKAKPRTDIYLLQWLIKCWCCAHKREKGMLNWRNKPWKWQGRRIYLCRAKDPAQYRPHERCTSLPLDGLELEKLVVYHVLRLLDADTYIKYLYENKSEFGVYTKQVKLDREKTQKRIDELKQKKMRITTLYKSWDISEEEYNKDKGSIIAELEKEVKALEWYNKKLESSTNMEAYALWLSEFQKQARANLGNNVSTSTHLKNLLNILIKQIIVDTRSVTPNDILPWIKVWDWVDRQIPHRIRIEMRLPQDFISNKLG